VKNLEDSFGALLSGAGAAILHITWFGAYELHHLIDAHAALVMASGVGALSLLLNARIGNAVFVVIAVAGTYLAAPLIGNKTGDFSGTLGLFLIWNLSYSALSVALKRRDVLLTAAYFAVLTVGQFSIGHATPDLTTSFLILQGFAVRDFYRNYVRVFCFSSGASSGRRELGRMPPASHFLRGRI